MQKKALRFGVGFKVELGNARVQAARMVIKPGDSEGGPQNRHRGADQWLYVVAGRGLAKIDGRGVKLKEGTLILIEHGEKREIRNTGTAALKTLNFCLPPAYTATGNELPAAKR
jgi:mannose-6-phosphate isomerase-like protein (cupin superfamily)